MTYFGFCNWILINFLKIIFIMLHIEDFGFLYRYVNTNINCIDWIVNTILCFWSFYKGSNLLLISSLYSWLQHEIFFTLVERWIKRSSQWISSFELVKYLLFFKLFECSSKILWIWRIFGWSSSGFQRLNPLNFNDLGLFEVYGNSTCKLNYLIGQKRIDPLW